ncbi:uncharacterized protein [Chelonus insularis]|uniref:uncharacterized protein isoform X2 n=1 Tax=Chelonus insularis TaxID=460826 RepID=UPI00158D2B40|nr:uncharacterized protein LOC118070246 isoform X2 [Chelonus insularis]
MKSSKNIGVGVSWGELPTRETHKQEVITPDIIENIWRQVLDDCNSTECDYQTDQDQEFIQLPVENPYVLNTIQLHRQRRSMENGLIIRGISSVDDINYSRIRKPKNPFHFLSPKKENEVPKNKIANYNLRPSTARNLLKHAVIVLIAHIGFEMSSDIAIETLVDIADNLLRKITFLLKSASEQQLPGFPDVLERILVETNIGSVADIYDYYQNYVIKFEKRVKRNVEIMSEKQQSELSTTAKLELEEAVNKLQFDELDHFVNPYKDVPTLQLLDPEIGFPPSLDAGFQMLHSLEQDDI